MNPQEIKGLMYNAFTEAVNKQDEGDTRGKINRSRSKNFIEELGNQFRTKFKVQDSFRVFTKHYTGNRKEFGLNELLYDLTVCEIGNIIAPRGEKLAVIKKAIWQVESELAMDTRQSVYDFNKLVIGAAENKLFIGPVVSQIVLEKYMATLEEAAVNCSGNIYLALLQHPDGWSNNTRTGPYLYSYENSKWVLIK